MSLLPSIHRVARAHRYVERLALGSALGSATWLWSALAGATPGTHPALVSTWDTTSSSVSGAFTSAFVSGGHLDFASYYANFSSTSGNISSQFGLHFVNFKPGEGIPTLNGFAGSATFVYSKPVMGRWDSGLPKLALGFYLGAAPTVTLSLNGAVPTSVTSAATADVSTAADLWIPVAAGFAVPFAPAKFVSLVPWIEVAVGPSVDLTEKVKSETVLGATTSVPSPSTNVGGAVDLRGGLKVDFHLGRAVDAGAALMLANFGSGFSGPFAVFVGGNLNYHWDDVVSGALTPKERLSHEDCVDVEERMQECPVTKTKAPLSPRPPSPAPSPPTPAPRPAAYSASPTPSAPATSPGWQPTQTSPSATPAPSSPAATTPPSTPPPAAPKPPPAP